MDKQTYTALCASIGAWEARAQGVRLSTGSDCCALCAVFYGEDDCGRCPVREATGVRACIRTPYDKAHAVKQNYGLGSLPFRLAAEAEVAFLKSLLPPEDLP